MSAELLAQVVEAAVRRAVEEARLADDRLLTVADVLALTGYSRATVDKMVARRQIPMWKAEGVEGWRITREAFRRAADAGFPVPNGRVQTKKRAA